MIPIEAKEAIIDLFRYLLKINNSGFLPIKLKKYIKEYKLSAIL